MIGWLTYGQVKQAYGLMPRDVCLLVAQRLVATKCEDRIWFFKKEELEEVVAVKVEKIIDG